MKKTKLRMVEVTWVDAHDMVPPEDRVWLTGKDVAARGKPVVVRSVGLLLGKRKGALVMCGSFINGGYARFGQAHVIPLGMVRKVRRLKKK